MKLKKAVNTVGKGEGGHLAGVVVSEQDVSGCNVSVDEALLGQVLQSQGHLGAEPQESLFQLRLDHHLSRPVRTHGTILRRNLTPSKAETHAHTSQFL